MEYIKNAYFCYDRSIPGLSGGRDKNVQFTILIKKQMKNLNLENYEIDNLANIAKEDAKAINGGLTFDEFAEWYVDTCYSIANSFAKGFVKGFNASYKG
ncbi:hypothetical protein EXU85_28805 [Spirosoma sp. KCTC 42546]|uniref:hypothetical protein n=1 Tax=Spirosoma sp. KCTC 42546 TaxID=2520506 RepID=UPI00115949B9|nr:hypothetical protein [Spirosoma sp. KCTC 42546]QDK82393.1 hypothetical protein EXU85_28805 [Spirosoma sp. KCTC 42546]